MVEAFDTWTDGKLDADYALYFDEWWRRDLEAMVLRDRNSPSVLLWSIGNEIGNRASPITAAVSRALSDRVRALDPAPRGSRRAITAAVPDPGGVGGQAAAGSAGRTDSRSA